MYIFISLLVLVTSYCLFKKAAGSLDIRRINMCSYVFYILLVYTFIGSVQVLYGVSTAEHLLPQDDSIRLYGWMAIMYTMVAVPIGMLIATLLLKVKSMKALLLRYQSAPLKTFFSYNEKLFRYTLYLFSCLSVLAIIYTIASLGSSVPLFNLIFGVDDYTFLYQLRNLARLHIEGYRFLTVYITLQANSILVITYVAYLYWKMEKRLQDLIWFSCMAFFLIIYCTHTLSKGPILFFIIGFIIVRIMIFGKLKKKEVIISGIVFFALMGILVIFFQGALKGTGESINLLNTFKVAYNTFCGRVVVGQIINFYNCLNIFPNLYPYLVFSTTGRLIHEILGLSYLPDYGIIVMGITKPAAVLKGVAGHATTFFMGEAWSNFGLTGILIAPLYVGFFIQVVNIFFLKSRKTPLHIAFYAMLTISFPILSSLKGFYYPAWLLQYAVMIFILLFVALILKSIARKSFRVEKRVPNVTA